MKKTIILSLFFLLLVATFSSAQWIRPNDNVFIYFLDTLTFVPPYLDVSTGNVTFNETKLNETIDARATGNISLTDTNESVRFNNLVAVNCTGQVVAGVYINGTPFCEADDTGGGSYDLNISTQNGVGVITDSEIFSVLGNGSITTFMSGNVLTISGQDNDTDTDTVWNINSSYLYNDSGSLSFNESRLNSTISALDTDTDTRWSLNTSVLRNESNSIGIVSSYWSNLYLQLTDQRYNETARINSVNSSLQSQITQQQADNATLTNQKGGIGTCTSGNFVQNVTSTGVECDAPSGSGDITSVTTEEFYIYNGSASGDVHLLFNETRLNATINAIAGSGSDTVWGLNQPYLYNNSGNLDFNETRLNLTINALENDTTYTASQPYLTTSGTNFDFNESKLNDTINTLDTDTDTVWTINTTVLVNNSGTLGVVQGFWDGLYLLLTDMRFNDSASITSVNSSLQSQISQEVLDNSTQDSLFYDSSETATFVNVTTDNVILTGDSANHFITDNTSCIIITSGTTTLNICE